MLQYRPQVFYTVIVEAFTCLLTYFVKYYDEDSTRLFNRNLSTIADNYE